MLFPTLGFLLFFLIVAAAMAVLGTRFAAKKTVLVVASYYFYAQWDWRFCLLLAGSSALSYIAGQLIDRASDERRVRTILGIAVALHLGLLGIFKYFDFFISSANQLARLLGLEHEVPFIEILLPVGISFFTFHGISYITDVYRRDVAVCRNPLDMLLYMSFFPQLVAGPIVRAAYFLPHLAAARRAIFFKKPAGRHPPRPVEDLPQPAFDDAARRALARRGMEIHRLGRLAWRRARGRALAGAVDRPARLVTGRENRRDADRLPFRLSRLDLLSRRGFRGRLAFHRRARLRLGRRRSASRSLCRGAHRLGARRPVHAGCAVRSRRSGLRACPELGARRDGWHCRRADQRARP